MKTLSAAFLGIVCLVMVVQAGQDTFKQSPYTGKPDNIGQFDKYSSSLNRVGRDFKNFTGLATYSSNGRMSKDDYRKVYDLGFNLASAKYGAKLDGVTDDSAAVAACLADALAARSAMIIPAQAKVRVTQGFTINQPIKVIGSGHMNFDHGSNFYVESTTDPLFTVTHPAVEFIGVNFYYPNQDTTGAAIVTYPPTLLFSNGTDSRVQHCRFFNTYDGIKYTAGARYNVDDVLMFTINKGIQVINSYDVNRFSGVQFTYGAWKTDNVPSEGMIEYTATNAVGFYFEHADMSMIDRAYFFGLDKGIVLNAGVGDLTDNLYLDSSGFDSTRIGIEITGWANYLKISNTLFVNFDGKYNHHASPPESPIGSNPLSYSIHNTHPYTSIEISNCAMSADGRIIWMEDGDTLNVSGGSMHTYGLAAANDAIGGYAIHATNLSEMYVTGVEMTNNPNVTKTTITSIYADSVDNVNLANITFGNVNRGVELVGTVSTLSRNGLTYKSDVTNGDTAGAAGQRIGSVIDRTGSVSISGGAAGGVGLSIASGLSAPTESASGVRIAPTTTPSTSMSDLFGVTFLPTYAGDSSTNTDVTTVNGFFARTDFNSTFRGTIANLHSFAIGNPTLNSASITNLVGLKIDSLTSGTNNYAISVANPIKLNTGGSLIFPDGTTQSTAATTISSSGTTNLIQYSNGSGGFSSNANIYKSTVGGTEHGIRADNLYAGTPGAGGKDLITAYDTAAAVNTRIPVITANVVPRMNSGATAYEASQIYSNSTGVGIGSAAVGGALEIRGATAPLSSIRAFRTDASSATGGSSVHLYVDDGAAMASGDRLAAILMGGARNATNTTQVGVRLDGYASAAWSDTSTPGDFVVNTTLSGSVTPNEKLRIASSGLITNSNGGGVPFGSMYTDTAFTVAVASADTWYEMDTVATNFTAGLLKNVTQSDHYLVATTAGYYSVKLCASLGTGVAGHKVAISTAINGTATGYGHGHTTIANAASTSEVCALNILQLAANDQVSGVVQNHSGAVNIDVDHAQMIMEYIGSP